MTPSLKPSTWTIAATFLSLIFLAACGRQDPVQVTTAAPAATSTLPPPSIRTTLAPDAENSARAFLGAWENENYPAMYAHLSPSNQKTITEEAFTALYENFALETALSSLETQILSGVTQTHDARISYRLALHSALVGDIQRDIDMDLSLQKGDWRIDWDSSLVFPELVDGNALRMEYQIPERGEIYDRDGQPMVARSDAVAIGIIPDQIDPDVAEGLFNQLDSLTGMRAERIQELYEESPEGAGWYVAIGTVSAEDFQARQASLTSYDGFVYRPYTSRFYFEGGIAPHVVGYVSPVQEEELDQLRRSGYRRDEKVGRIGLESWGEEILSGVRGGTLNLISPEGVVLEQIAASTSQPAQSIYTTIDSDLQLQAQQAIVDFLGAIVVLERDTGRVLAMVSSPGFDPNLFEPQNFNREFQIQDLFDQQAIPLLNRATQGQYPLGSVFKIITMAAGMESGLYSAETTYECQHEFNELPDVTLYDWTLEKEFPPSGILTLPEGLMRSCNNYFYHIGLDLYDQGLTTANSDMARDFGLGSPTGIGQLEEESGQVPDPGSRLYATSLAIGQADLLVTPLQVANFIAAVGNGGTLYRPQVVEQLAPAEGEPTYTFEPEVRGELSVSQQNLQVIQDAMVSVVANRRGTAYREFINFRIPFAGKTGTAQDTPRDPHAWFAGYTFAENPDRPDIAAAVIVENIGDGSEFAAPIFRRVMEAYFFGRPLTPYPWEQQIGVPRPEPTETPTPEEGE